MPDILDYLKSLNPQRNEQAILIYGSNYHLWRDGEYLGTAVWTKDDNVGDSFQTGIFDEETGITIQQVFLADKWELVISK